MLAQISRDTPIREPLGVARKDMGLIVSSHKHEQLPSTECIQTSFEFAAAGNRQVVAKFDGGITTSDGGGLLLGQTDQRIDLRRRLASCFTTGRDPEKTDHPLDQLLAQRIYGLALGYEDLNDPDQLRSYAAAGGDDRL